MRFAALSTFISVACVAISEVHAWGVLGHQTVALVAQNYLLSKTVTEVQSILDDTSASYMGNVATWADEFRSKLVSNSSISYSDSLDR